MLQPKVTFLTSGSNYAPTQSYIFNPCLKFMLQQTFYTSTKIYAPIQSYIFNLWFKFILQRTFYTSTRIYAPIQSYIFNLWFKFILPTNFLYLYKNVCSNPKSVLTSGSNHDPTISTYTGAHRVETRCCNSNLQERREMSTSKLQSNHLNICHL